MEATPFIVVQLPMHLPRRGNLPHLTDTAGPLLQELDLQISFSDLGLPTKNCSLLVTDLPRSTNSEKTGY
ncbi:MAG: hypothetical protein RL339_1307 [Pseudomonadota bacterium]